MRVQLLTRPGAVPASATSDLGTICARQGITWKSSTGHLGRRGRRQPHHLKIMPAVLIDDHRVPSVCRPRPRPKHYWRRQNGQVQ